MTRNSLKVLQIDTEMTWRGGENQLRLLLEGGLTHASWYLAAPCNSAVAERLQHLAVHFPLERSTFQWLPAIPRLLRFCRAHAITVIDCQSSKAHSIGLLLKRYLPQVKLVVHRRVDFEPAKGWWSQRKYQHPSVDAYVAISAAIANILSTAGIPQEKIHIVRSAVDPQAFQNTNRAEARKSVCQELGLKENIGLICNVAYHTAQKGQTTLIHALAELKKRQVPCYALFAGEGPLTAELKRLVESLALNHEVRFLGIRKDIPRLLAASDILAMPSRFEGLGTSILDGIYSGCAVAASEVGGIPEMIHHEKTGLLSAVDDYHNFAKNLESLLLHADKRQRLVDAAQTHVAKLFSLEQMVQGNLAVYHSLLNP